jgi:hypothetical protein
MADHEKLPFHELSAINQQTLATAYWAMDYYFDNLRKTISAIPSGGSEFGEKMKACADKNVSLTQEFARQLRQAKNLQEVYNIQTNFMQEVLRAFEEQTQFASDAFKKTVSKI